MYLGSEDIFRGHIRRQEVWRKFVILIVLVALTLLDGAAIAHAAPVLAETAVTRAYTSARPGPIIPDHGCLDNASVTQSVVVPDTFLLGAVRVGVNLTHPWRGDIFVRLTSPDGTNINILNLADGYANYNVLIDDTSTNASGEGAGAGAHDPNAAAWQYTWRSAAGLGVFKGTPTAGTWTLTVCDRYWGDRGQLNYWSLYLDEDRSDYAGTVVSTTPANAAYTGNTLTYNIVVPNNTGRAGAVTLVAPFPAGAAYVAGSGRMVPSNGAIVITNGQLTWTGNFVPNQTITVTYQAAVTALNGWLTNTVTISDPLSLTAVMRKTVTPVAAPQYRASQIAVTPATGALVNAGQLLTYSISITNSGQVAGNATLLNPIPAGVAYVAGSARSSDGAVVNFVGAAITWGGRVAAGARVSISYQARVSALSELALLDNAITNTATISDPLALGMATISAASFVAAPVYTLSTIKVALKGGGVYILPGQPVTVVIGLYNSGTRDGNGAITVPLSSAATFVSGSASATSGAAPILNSEGLSWSSAVAAGQRITLTYKLIVNAFSGAFTSTVTILDNQIGVPTVKTAVNPIATPLFDASTLMPNKAAVAVGERFTYTLVIHNSGLASGAASGAVVALPVGLQPAGTPIATAGSAQWDSTGVAQLVWNGSIPDGSSVTIQIPVIASSLCGSQIALAAALTDSAVAPAVTTINAPAVQTYYNLIFNEDFGSAAAGLPAGWSLYRNSGNCDFDAANWYNHTGGTGGYMVVNSFTCGESASIDTELRTPVFSLANVTAPVLQFRYDYYRGLAWGQVAAVDISTAGSAGPWTNVWKLTGDDRGPKLARIDLKAYAGKSNLTLRFHYAAPYWAYWWQIDDVLLYQVCPVSIGPEALREGAACRGKSVTYTLSVANMTALADSIKITTTVAAGWLASGSRAVIQPATVQLNPGASGVVNVVVTVPWTMGSGLSADTIVIAQGANSGQSGQVILRTTAGSCTSWTALAPVPAAAGDAGLAYYNGTLYQIGGRADGAYLPTSAVYRYTISANAWQTMTSIPISVAGTDAALLGDVIYVPGGETNAQSNSQTTLVQAYRPAMNSWTSYAVAPLPIPLAYYEAHALNGRLYVIGGYSSGAVTNTLLIYDPSTNTWTRGAPLAQARMFAAAGVIGGKLYVAGGYDGARGLDSLEVFMPNADGSGSWSAGPAMPRPKDSSASGVLGDRYLIAAGGWDADAKRVTGGVTAYDVQAGVWVTLPIATSLRVGARAEGDGTRLFAVGGYDVSTGEPCQEYVSLYGSVKRELGKMGIRFRS